MREREEEETPHLVSLAIALDTWMMMETGIYITARGVFLLMLDFFFFHLVHVLNSRRERCRGAAGRLFRAWRCAESPPMIAEAIDVNRCARSYPET